MDKYFENSIIEESGIGNRRNVFRLIIDCLKIKNKIRQNEKRDYGYRVKWIIRDEKSKWTLYLKLQYKILLRSLIIGLILIKNESDIYFGININILKLLNEFMKNLSNRRKLDEKMYIDLMFMENFLKKTKMNIESCNSKILTELDDLKRNLRKELNEEKDKKSKEYSVEFIDD